VGLTKDDNVVPEIPQALKQSAPFTTLAEAIDVDH
jgi:hypothetical protein